MELMLFGTDNVYRKSIASAEVSAEAPERRVRWAQAFTIAFGFVGVIIYILSKINGCAKSLRFITDHIGCIITHSNFCIVLQQYLVIIA